MCRIIPLQADLQRTVWVTGVVTQGREDYYDYDQWIKTFVVYHSSDCIQFSAVKGLDGYERVQYSAVIDG